MCLMTLDNLIVNDDTDDEENNTDTKDNCHPSFKKHKLLAATPKTSSAHIQISSRLGKEAQG